jgi:hypothetical protein
MGLRDCWKVIPTFQGPGTTKSIKKRQFLEIINVKAKYTGKLSYKCELQIIIYDHIEQSHMKRKSIPIMIPKKR